jgi:outer membrane cobalamin receptor
MYGGNAEYAVINIITASPECRNGTKITTSYGQMEKTYGRRNLSVCTGARRNDFGYSVSLFAGEANRSDHLYHDLWGNSYNMGGHSKITSAHLNIGMNYKNFHFRGIADRYTVFTRDNYDLITSKAYPVRFETYVADLSKEISISPLFKVTPRISYKLQLPWYFKGTVNNDEFKQFEVSSARLTSGVISSWDPVKQFRLTTGLEFFYDQARQLGNDVFVSNGSKKFQYNNTSFFTEGNLKSRFVNINVGARYSNSNWTAPSFVPRISLTKTIDRFHVKVLYSQAYRAPNTENMDLNPEIQFETTTVVEFESGYMFSDRIYLTGNVYDIRTKNPIIYSYDLATDQDEYINSERTGTQGVEFDFRFKLKKFFINLGYAFYSAENLERLAVYEVSTNRSALLGLPNQKISLNTGIKIKDNLSLNTSAIWSGIKYGVVSLDDAGNSTIGKYNPLLLWNFSVKYENVFLENLSASLGVFNLLNGIEYYVQPYNSGHGALPGPSREIVLSLSYKISNR